MEWSVPFLAQRLTVVGLTARMAATSDGIRRRSSASFIGILSLRETVLLRRRNTMSACEPFAIVRTGLLWCRVSIARERNQMPKYRVTVRRTSVEIVEADNPFQAAVVASSGIGDGVEIADVRPAVGRIPATVHKAAAKTTKKATKKAVKKRRPLSPEARAKLAQNLVKARAARARNLKAAKKSTKKSTKKAAAKKSTKKAAAKTKSVKRAVKRR